VTDSLPVFAIQNQHIQTSTFKPAQHAGHNAACSYILQLYNTKPGESVHTFTFLILNIYVKTALELFWPLIGQNKSKKGISIEMFYIFAAP
jgi:hypothetical protein